ncbi:homeobox protein cut-like 1 isoform X4 [Dreissena polymorpha]|uniref:homeobox protein cut-like 1 isoform X4 n=1 Tax=Dreissena polymorpha TaxID=45954 RepID=UPI0022649114|nr:homeobox protein cut-like 1 isoform X4 [Dreissena polymorpha]
MAASVQSMLEFWQKFDLQELQKELDTTATELANRQDESDTSRKRLVDLSREFKKTTPEDIRKLVAPLLKSFQGEIDALSKRSKAAEAAFLSVYKKLIDLPDPVGVLDYAQQLQKKAHRVQDLEIENKQLRETLDEYNHEFAEVKNQEVTIKQLRERLKEGEDRIEAVAEARTKEKERDLQKSFAEKERQLQETQIAVSRKLGEAEQRVAALTNTLENVQSELFEVKAKYDEATSAKHDETEMIMSDLERANERATAAEREADRLRHQLTSLTTGLAQGGTGEGAQSGGDMEQAIEMLQRSNLEAELATKEREITQLVEDVQRLQASLQKLRENTSQQVSRLEEELASKNKAFKILEERLRSQEDYEEIKRELSVLKSIEFSGGVGSDEVDGDLSHTTSLEMQLLRKNKSLQSENTQIKVNCNDLSGSSSPAHSSNTKDFTSVLEEEIAETFQEKQSPKESGNNGLPSISPTYLPKEDQELKSPCSVDSGDIPPMVASSPDSSKTLHRSASVSDTMRIPPPTSHYFHPAFTNSHLLANYMSLGMGFHNNNNNNTPKPDLNSCQGLDTSMVAKTVRELLSIHNIGQRLFAKHVLGLSQGTVSELLSKPKSWDKLTEKGRESYRKMHSWATDDRNIMALKAISPKKAHRKSPDDLGPFVGTQPLLPSIQREDSVTEERIAHILNEAQQAMQQKRSVEESWSKEQNNVMINNYLDMARHYAGPHFPLMSPGRIHTSLHEHSRKLSDTDRRDKQNDPEMSSKEMVERIYRQELIKLAQAAENAGNIAASALYQRELARLAQNVRMRDDPEPGEVRHVHSSPENRLKVKQEKSERPEDLTMGQCNGPIDLSKRSPSTPSTPTSGGSDKSVNSSSAHVGSAFFQMHPKMMNGHEQGDRGMKSESQSSPHAAFPQFSPSDTSSPLQRMQNIANSLMNRSQIGTPCNKPLKAVLPPITQEEFDSYANINTEDLVKQVKETLSQYSISQRLFGESVLGLSQGSVSDLLARPKPWHMLTQKGREPFIRMQLFLEDAEAIPKLVASQYHIAPDKLMRSNSVSKEHDLDHVTLWQNMRASLPLGGLPLVSPSLGLGMAAFSQANRRRRHSLEDRYDSSIALPKRPRVFFSEEQKERLRQAYNRDPYPNQSTIEALASALGVGVKTVINWFHNHRMRAKQQQHSSSPTTPYSDYSQSGMGKEESNDDNSNNSDLSSFSENREALAALGFRFINSDNNQWMFPKFEPMASKSGSQGSDNIDESEGDDGDYDEIDDDAKDDDANIAKDVDKDSENMEMDKDESGSEDSPNEKNENDNGDELFKGQVSSVVPSAGANRRKRSHPQYVSAGRHLDRTVNITTQDRSEEHDRENMDGQISCLEVKENKENVNCQEEGSVENVKRNIDSLEGKTNCTIEGKLSPTLS